MENCLSMLLLLSLSTLCAAKNIPPCIRHPTGALNERSLSPWTIESTYDPDRTPKYVEIARCKDDACINPAAHNPNCYHLSHTLQSLPLNRTIAVVYRKSKPQSGDYDIEVRQINVTVACLCVFSEFVQSS